MSQTLILDLGYQPHRIVSWQRAITMLFQGKVELIEEYNEIIYSKTYIIKMPAVVRLLRKVTRKKVVRFSRMNVLTRDDWRCQYCGVQCPTDDLNYDHVIPRSQGGQTVWENIVTACYPCNARKGDRTPEKAGMRLRKKPYKPQSLPVVVFRFDKRDSIPDAWASWIYWHGKLQEG